MAAVFDLGSLLARANAPASSAAPPPPPVSTATPNPVAAPFPGLGALNTEAPAPSADPNKSQFANMLSDIAINGTPGKLAAMQAASAAAAQQPTAWEYLKNFVGGNKATDAALAQRQSVSNTVGHPIAQNIIANTPEIANLLKTDPVGTAAKLQPLIEAASGAPPAMATHATPAGTLVKDVADPAHLAAVAKITGEHYNDVNPFLNHRDYTDDEFVAATKHLNWDQASRIFGAAQRLSPQQQITNQYAGILHDNVARAEQAYQEAVAGKMPKGTTDKLQQARDAANNEARAFLKKIAEGAQVMFPDSAVQ